MNGIGTGKDAAYIQGRKDEKDRKWKKIGGVSPMVNVNIGAIEFMGQKGSKVFPPTLSERDGG